MNSSLFIALLNPAIALIVASAFVMLWFYQRQRPYLAVLALAYGFSAAGFLLQHFTLPIGLPISRLVSTVSFTIGAICLSSAIVARYGRKVPYVAFGILGSAGLVAFSWFMFVDSHLTLRIYAINFAFGGISLVVAAELRMVVHKGPTEKILFALALMSGLNFFVRTMVAIRINGPYETYEGFYASLYWTTALLSHAVLSLLVAFSLLTAAALDILKALKSESHTDPLSGLLNRRGFEDAASQALERSNRLGLPTALVIADLDHFKTVNDTFGHAVGDKVIIGFAAHLQAATARSGIAGRIGGEEFAVLLTASDLASARLFAEGVRASIAQETMRDVPDQASVTASFGVASRSGEESLSELLCRADDALYHAKKGGRDRVRVSYLRAPENPLQEVPLRPA